MVYVRSGGIMADRQKGRTTDKPTTKNMKLNLLFKRIPATAANRTMVTSTLDPLHEELVVTAASATIERAAESTPAYRAAVHLEVPGPDIRASASDYTMAAAWRKVMAIVRSEVDRRAAHRKSRHASRTQRRPRTAMAARA